MDPRVISFAYPRTRATLIPTIYIFFLQVASGRRETGREEALETAMRGIEARLAAIRRTEFGKGKRRSRRLSGGERRGANRVRCHRCDINVRTFSEWMRYPPTPLRGQPDPPLHRGPGCSRTARLGAQPSRPLAHTELGSGALGPNRLVVPASTRKRRRLMVLRCDYTFNLSARGKKPRYRLCIRAALLAR